MRATNRLTALEVKNLPSGQHCDGAGLWLRVRDDGGKQWIFRYTIHGRRREMGLGSALEVSLKEAREEADKWRAVVRLGKDAIKERERLRREADKSDTKLSIIAAAAFEAKKAELKNDGKAGRWLSPLENHVLPRLGKVPIEELDQQDIKMVLSPIWHTKAETARKALNRLGIVIRYAAAMGLDVDLQATMKAKELLGKSRHVPKHIASLDWQAVPEFYTTLKNGTITELALKLLILTAVRSGPLRKARWEEIYGNTWIIPAEGMKGRQGEAESFRVPLSAEVLKILEEARKFERDGYVFPGLTKGVISDMTMLEYLKDRGYEFRPHGFRTSFRTWCSKTKGIEDKHAEIALAHKFGTKVTRAYDRDDFLEERRIIMERWGEFVSGGTGEVVRLVADG